jgi:hypothetical protein
VCADGDQCRANISKALGGEPYKLTSDQIDDAAWRYASAATADNTSAAVIAGLNETDSTPVAGQPAQDQDADAPAFTIVAVPKPAVPAPDVPKPAK